MKSLFYILCFSLFFSCGNKNNNTNTSVPTSNRTDNNNSKVKIDCYSISPDEKNVFYLGIDNRINVESNFAGSEIKVTSSGSRIGRISPKEFIVQPKKLGVDTISVTAEDVTQLFYFPIENIPEPEPSIHSYRIMKGGDVSTKVFFAVKGLFALRDGFDSSIRCKILEFDIVKKNKEGVTRVKNTGAVYIGEGQKLIRSAEPKDTFIFTNMKVKCGDDPEKEYTISSDEWIIK